MTTINTAISNPAQKNAISKEKQDAGQLEKAVVEQIISDQTSASELKSAYPDIFKSFTVDRIPRNSCIVRRIVDGADTKSSSAVLAYPFFSSHFCLPVKAGETIWIIFDREVKTVGYWMSRVHGDERAEDLSFSHYDRVYKPSEDKSTSPGTAEKAKAVNEAPKPAKVADFANFSLKKSNGKDEYEKILSSSADFTMYEPIPRFTKRPGDFVIQGSNNSMILLGTDRYWTSIDELENKPSNARNKPTPFTGVIDIVAGRARGLLSGSVGRTTPPVVKNSRGYEEIVKDLQKNEKSIGVEGDPDFHLDAARIYVTMNTKIDDALTLADFIPLFPGEEEARPTSIGSAVIAKADHIRVVARKDEFLGINGTIRLIKEGQLGAEGDGCSILMHEDGTIHVASKKIYFGLTEVDGGKLNIEDTTSQPYVKYQELKQLFINLINQVEVLRNDLNKHIDNFNSHTHLGTCGVGPVQTQPVTSRSTTNKKKFTIADSVSDEEDYDKLIENMKSLIIFGE